MGTAFEVYPCHEEDLIFRKSGRQLEQEIAIDHSTTRPGVFFIHVLNKTITCTAYTTTIGTTILPDVVHEPK